MGAACSECKGLYDSVPCSKCDPGSKKPEPSEPEATPAAEEAAKEAGVDLSEVEGTGKGGRVTKADVEDAVSADESVEPEAGQDA